MKPHNLLYPKILSQPRSCLTALPILLDGFISLDLQAYVLPLLPWGHQALGPLVSPPPRKLTRRGCESCHCLTVPLPSISSKSSVCFGWSNNGDEINFSM